MTLRAVFNKEKTKSIKEIMPNEIIVYKVAILFEGKDPLRKMILPKYFSPVLYSQYENGEQCNFCDLTPLTVPIADEPEKKSMYYPGFHSFVNKIAANKLLEDLFPTLPAHAVILTCGVLKKWIIAIGFEGERDLVIVSNRIAIPSYPYMDIRDDKNCDWFFASQSKTAQADASPKNVINWIRPEEKRATAFRQNRKHKNSSKGF
jgi:hypothetical protein